MMTTTNAIIVDAPAGVIFDLASQTERWPQILPHYRSVRLLCGDSLVRVVEMAAWRDRIPIRWIAEQVNDPAVPRIRFSHIAGWTRGMDVEWIFTSLGERTEVRIEHRLRFNFPICGEWIGEHVIGDFFVHHVAGKTLACIKRLAEGEERT
jgi:ribosome-associated toxin RatA of RatAB toxin-antitoxin module